jgi:hypothetical protein
VNAVAGQGVQIAGERGDQRFSFAGLHFGNLALVQHHAADQLHIEVTHLHGAPAGLAHHGEGLGQNLVESRTLGGLQLVGIRNAFDLLSNPSPEFNGLGAQLLIRKQFGDLFEVVDLRHHRP